MTQTSLHHRSVGGQGGQDVNQLAKENIADPVGAVSPMLGAALTAFGVIHSVEPSGGVYLPWQLDDASRTVAWQFTAAYAVLAVLIGALSLQRKETPT